MASPPSRIIRNLPRILRGSSARAIKKWVKRHIPLLTDAAGRRLSKRDGDGCMENVRARYTDARPVIGALAAALGLIPTPESISLRELIPLFDWEKLPRDAVLLPEGF